MSSPQANFCKAILAGAALVACATARAQDMEPRVYTNSPTGLSFAIGGYAYSKGSVHTDPALPVDNVSVEAHTALFALATTLNVFGKSAKVDMIVPYTSLAAEGMVLGVHRERLVTDFGDPFFRFSMNFYGAPALTMEEFASYKQDWIIGASLRISPPLGHYDEDKRVNVGSNRWSFRPEIGVSKAWGRWTVEFAPGGGLLHGQRRFLRRQDARTGTAFRPAVERDLHGHAQPVALAQRFLFRWRAHHGRWRGKRRRAGRCAPRRHTLAAVNRHHSVKLYALRGFDAQRDADLDVIGVAWQYRWGGGF